MASRKRPRPPRRSAGSIGALLLLLLLLCAPWGPGVSESATPGPTERAGSTILFSGDRFAAARGGPVGQSISIDPWSGCIASGGRIRDFCGRDLSAGPEESPGLAWDLRTGLYWQILSDGTVRRMKGAAPQDTAFVIPSTFVVPGSGVDTLESIRGIAVDSSFVYVVGAGPQSAREGANGWFKFTRSGEPVKSSRSTDLLGRLDRTPGARFEDITYVPASSPFHPGRLLIALRGSGIVVIDTEGEYVDELRFGAPSSRGWAGKIDCSGTAVDPRNGNVHIAGAANGRALVLVRLPRSGPASYVIGTDGERGFLESPDMGCDMELPHDYATGPGIGPSRLFAIAYRESNASVYGIDFGTGGLWRFDPRVGAAVFVRATTLTGIRGLAYDAGRDVFYGVRWIDRDALVYVIDPGIGTAARLPEPVGRPVNDLAFNPVDRCVYGVSTDRDPPELVRIDRDTGAGAVVGATVALRGVDHDPARGMLIGIREDRSIWAVDPGTGKADSLAKLPRGDGGKGLAVVPVAAPSRRNSVERRWGERRRMDALSYDPARPASTSIRFEMREAGPVSVSVVTEDERPVRELFSGALGAGRHVMTWDGKDDFGDPVDAGSYVVQIRTARSEQIARITLLR